MRGAFAFAVSRGDAPLRCRRRAAPVVPRLGRLAGLRGHVLMALSRNRASRAQRGYGGGEQPDPGTPPYSRQPLLIGGARVRAPNESGNTKSIYTKPRGTNGLAPPPSARPSLSCPIGYHHPCASSIVSRSENRTTNPAQRTGMGLNARHISRGSPMQAGIGERKPYFGASTMTI
jgi:hypothetical protein